jgi:hypothetical protein
MSAVKDGVAHYVEAERIIQDVQQTGLTTFRDGAVIVALSTSDALLLAQIHATLALASATIAGK